jgi:hypothetical protein
MAIRDDFIAGEVLAAADLNDTFASKLNLAGGKVLQVVRDTDTTDRTTTSTALVDVTGMTITITPQKSDSAVLLVCNFLAVTTNAVNDNMLGIFSLTDNSNNAISGAESGNVATINLQGTGTKDFSVPICLIGYATPATTSAVTYKLRFRSSVAQTTTKVQNSISTGQIYAIEVSA